MNNRWTDEEMDAIITAWLACYAAPYGGLSADQSSIPTTLLMVGSDFKEGASNTYRGVTRETTQLLQFSKL